MGRRNFHVALMANPKLKFKNNTILHMQMLKSNPVARAIEAQMSGMGAVRREEPMDGSGKMKKYKPLVFKF